MTWGRRREQEAGAAAVGYERLSVNDSLSNNIVPKGYVPVMVGTSDEEWRLERFIVQIKLFKEPWMVGLLDKAAELGYGRDGVLRIPCEVEEFREVIGSRSRGIEIDDRAL